VANHRHGFYLILRQEDQITCLTQLMWFQLLSKPPPTQTFSDFMGFAEVAGTLVGLLPNSKVRTPHY